MTTLDNLFSTDAGLRVQQANYRKSLLLSMANKVASDLMAESTSRNVAVPVLSGFLKGILPAGKGQAEKADAAANAMVDEELAALGHTQEAIEDVTSEGESNETETQGQEVAQEVEESKVTGRKTKAA